MPWKFLALGKEKSVVSSMSSVRWTSMAFCVRGQRETLYENSPPQIQRGLKSHRWLVFWKGP
jgi:hypothetical protein